MMTIVTRKPHSSPTQLLFNFLGILKEYKFRFFFYIHWKSSIRVNSPTPIKLLRSLKIVNKGLILPPPLKFTFIEDLQ